MITKNFQKVKKIKGVKILSNTAAREAGASVFTFYQIIGSSAKRAWRVKRKRF